MDTAASPTLLLLRSTPLPYEYHCADKCKEETEAALTTRSPSLLKVEATSLGSPGTTSESNRSTSLPTKQLMIRSSFRPVIIPVIQKEIQLKALKYYCQYQPKNVLHNCDLFVEKRRLRLCVYTTSEQYQAYLTALKGTPIETKSLHKYIKIITKRILNRKRKFSNPSVEDLQLYDDYDKGNCTFLTMQALFGITSCGANTYRENAKHDHIRKFVLYYYSSPEMAASTATGIMNFEQKLAMLKYLQRFETMVLQPLKIGWK